MNISRIINQYYILTFIALALLLGCADNEEKVQKKSSNQNARKVSPEISIAASENKKVFFENGVLKAEFNYSNGKLQGISKEYYRNGKLRSELFYRKGKVITETRKKYYATDALLTVTNYMNGKLHGVCRTYFENGQLQDETHFEAGKQIANERFYINGQIYSICEQLDATNVKICRTYYQNGNVQSERKYIKGVPTSLRKKFYKNGQLKTISNVIDQFGYMQEFYETGNIKKERILKNDQIRTVNEYYENGQLMEIINYKKGKKHGVSKFFDENSDLALVQLWMDDVLIEEIFHEADSNN